MTKPTSTINRLHFSDLDPIRFEDLCLNLIYRLDAWKEINHFGRKGSDEGIDILAKKILNGQPFNCVIQCKRYTNISKKELQNIVTSIVENNFIPDKLIIIVSCDISKTATDFVKEFSLQKGIKETELWTSSILEAKLYNDYKDLLFVYFGITTENKKQSNESKIKHKLRMERRILRDFIDHEYIQKINNFSFFVVRPESKFICQRVFIHSSDDTTYPSTDDKPNGEKSLWFKTTFYNTYENGLEFWLSPARGTQVLMDDEGYWEYLEDYYDPRIQNSKYKVLDVKMIGRIPYVNIIDYKTSGDEYSNDPHIYCRFNINDWVYEKVYFKIKGNPEKEIPDQELHESMKTNFPK